jgi:hypothetical protein
MLRIDVNVPTAVRLSVPAVTHSSTASPRRAGKSGASAAESMALQFVDPAQAALERW